MNQQKAQTNVHHQRRCADSHNHMGIKLFEVFQIQSPMLDVDVCSLNNLKVFQLRLCELAHVVTVAILWMHRS